MIRELDSVQALIEFTEDQNRAFPIDICIGGEGDFCAVGRANNSNQLFGAIAKLLKNGGDDDLPVQLRSRLQALAEAWEGGGGGFSGGGASGSW